MLKLVYNPSLSAQKRGFSASFFFATREGFVSWWRCGKVVCAVFFLLSAPRAPYNPYYP